MQLKRSQAIVNIRVRYIQRILADPYRVGLDRSKVKRLLTSCAFGRPVASDRSRDLYTTCGTVVLIRPRSMGWQARVAGIQERSMEGI